MYSACKFLERVALGASVCGCVRKISLWKLNKSFCAGQYGFSMTTVCI